MTSKQTSHLRRNRFCQLRIFVLVLDFPCDLTRHVASKPLMGPRVSCRDELYNLIAIPVSKILSCVSFVHVEGLRRWMSLNCGHQRVYCPGDIWIWRATVEWYLQGNQRTRRRTCPSATLSTTWTDPVASADLRAERPATNRLSHSTALRFS
jgi:hypothetical protein